MDGTRGEVVGSTESDDGGWSTIKEEVPFSGNKPIESSFEEQNHEEVSALAELRRKHAAFLRGAYDPTFQERVQFFGDKEFYDSGEYQELERFYSSVWHPPKEDVIRQVEPFFDSVREDVGKLLRIGSKLNGGGELTKGERRCLPELVTFFAEKFGIQNIPSLELVDEGRGAGNYNVFLNTITIKNDETETTEGYINTIAHEMWHAYQHQHKDENEKYEFNFANYVRSSVDFDAYVDQLVEIEANTIGHAIELLYKKSISEMPQELKNERRKNLSVLGKFEKLFRREK